MSYESDQLTLCPTCGSKYYLENYPVQGTSICTNCGHEATSISLKVIQEDIDDTSCTCSSCGKEQDEKPLFDKDHRIVFKCKTCGKLDGYLLLPSTWKDNEDLDDNDYDGISVINAKTEGKLIYPGYSAKKEVTALECLKEFETLINEKKEIMMKMGVDFQTINLATAKATNHLAHKGPFTDKQLKHVFPAAFILAQSNLLDFGKLKGTKLTERQLAEIFDVDRKTTRKWKDALKNDTG